jgi:hypothetical protein
MGTANISSTLLVSMGVLGDTHSKFRGGIYEGAVEPHGDQWEAMLTGFGPWRTSEFGATPEVAVRKLCRRLASELAEAKLLLGAEGSRCLIHDYCDAIAAAFETTGGKFWEAW